LGYINRPGLYCLYFCAPYFKAAALSEVMGVYYFVCGVFGDYLFYVEEIAAGGY
jgi:hypothetical protein